MLNTRGPTFMQAGSAPAPLALTRWLHERGVETGHFLQAVDRPCGDALPAGTASAWAVALEPLAHAVASHLAGAPLPARLAQATPEHRLRHLAGRLCAERGVHALLGHRVAVASGAHGAPVWPADCTGSISHGDQEACALVVRSSVSSGVGIDVETVIQPHVAPEIAGVCCTPRERDQWLATADHHLALTVIFSAKECLYKALAPWLRRFIDFDEVEVTALVPEHRVLRLQPRTGGALEGVFAEVTAHYRESASRNSVMCALSLPAAQQLRGAAVVLDGSPATTPSDNGSDGPSMAMARATSTHC